MVDHSPESVDAPPLVNFVAVHFPSSAVVGFDVSKRRVHLVGVHDPEGKLKSDFRDHGLPLRVAIKAPVSKKSHVQAPPCRSINEKENSYASCQVNSRLKRIREIMPLPPKLNRPGRRPRRKNNQDGMGSLHRQTDRARPSVSRQRRRCRRKRPRFHGPPTESSSGL